MDVFRFTESAIFTRRWHKLGLFDDDLAALQLRLMKNPEEVRSFQVATDDARFDSDRPDGTNLLEP
jgi:hypothetical protein